MDKNVSAKVANYLLEIGSVKLNLDKPFQWSSGWQSPIYCDNRLLLSYPDIRTFIKTEMAKAITHHFADATAIVGVATAGIALGALVADTLNLPFAYCRPKPKEHGMKNQLEGRIANGSKVVVIEDLISTGGSSLKVVSYLKEQQIEVMGLAGIFTYGFPIANIEFEKASCPFFTLSNYDILIQEALQKNIILPEHLVRLNAWKLNPEKGIA